jgi:hypothetical protein
VQSFLDHASLSTTSQYLKVDRQGMHRALKNAEKTRDLETRRAACGNRVANATAAGSHPETQRGRKSVR